MKLRINGNSVRLRLSKTDIQQLKENGRVANWLKVGEQELFEYQLVRSRQTVVTGASFKNNSLLVWIPEAAANLLTDTKQMSIEAKQPVMDEEELHILIEKDLKP